MIAPYYGPIDGITIYHGDCAEIAPQLGRFDLLCTDPPYGIGEARGKNKSRSRPRSNKGAMILSKDYGISDWDDATPDDSLIESLRSRCDSQCIFGGNYFRLPPSPCWLVWDKENGANDFADAELAWTNYRGATRLKRYLQNGMCRAAPETRYHPTQKPLAVMSWAISLCPERPTTVLDPFMGSGTTLVACKNLGIQCVGIERELRYIDVAIKRLGQGVLPGLS